MAAWAAAAWAAAAWAEAALEVAVMAVAAQAVEAKEVVVMVVVERGVEAAMAAAMALTADAVITGSHGGVPWRGLGHVAALGPAAAATTGAAMAECAWRMTAHSCVSGRGV